MQLKAVHKNCLGGQILIGGSM